jgi:hypothetical protein
MRLHPLFPMVKTAALYLVPVKSYSKNTHAPFILKWAIIFIIMNEKEIQMAMLIE